MSALCKAAVQTCGFLASIIVYFYDINPAKLFYIHYLYINKTT